MTRAIASSEILLLCAVFLLVLTSLFALMGVNPLINPNRPQRLNKGMLQARRERVTGRKLKRKEKILNNIDGMLKRLGKDMSFLYLLLAVSCLMGVGVGNLLFQNLLLALITGACFLPLPYLYLQIRTRWYIRQEAESLENSMSIITNAYLGCDDILKAFELYVKEERRVSGEKISPFADFVTELVYINPNVERGLLVLAEKVNNEYFSQWIKMLILCHYDRRIKFSLRPIVDSMNDAKSIQIESETSMMKIWREYFLTVGLMFGVIPVLKTANEKWFELLTQTTVGNVLIILMLLAALISAFAVMKINKPVGLR